VEERGKRGQPHPKTPEVIENEGVVAVATALRTTGERSLFKPAACEDTSTSRIFLSRSQFLRLVSFSAKTAKRTRFRKFLEFRYQILNCGTSRNAVLLLLM
jgi:hypothetical protein